MKSRTIKSLTQAAMELQQVRDQLKVLRERETELGDMFRDIIDVDMTRVLDGVAVTVSLHSRETLDREKLTKFLGEKAIKKYEKVTIYTTVKVEAI